MHKRFGLLYPPSLREKEARQTLLVETNAGAIEVRRPFGETCFLECMGTFKGREK